MSSRDLFGVALRVLGVWFLYMAADEAVWLVFRMTNVVRDNPLATPLEDKTTEHVVIVGFYLILSFVLLVLTDKIVSQCYGPKSRGS